MCPNINISPDDRYAVTELVFISILRDSILLFVTVLGSNFYTHTSGLSPEEAAALIFWQGS